MEISGVASVGLANCEMTQLISEIVNRRKYVTRPETHLIHRDDEWWLCEDAW